jgi:hypothetical protein
VRELEGHGVRLASGGHTRRLARSPVRLSRDAPSRAGGGQATDSA